MSGIRGRISGEVGLSTTLRDKLNLKEWVLMHWYRYG